ncbi:MAG: polyphosphate kinase 1 [Victivallaceae bacterium]
MSDLRKRDPNYISREISWLDFNSRVLDEAATTANPLLERLKFLAIFSSNLDEFFMVRIAGLRQLVALEQDEPDPAGVRPSEQLAALRKMLDKLLPRRLAILHEVLAALEEHRIRIRRPRDLDAETVRKLRRYFDVRILPVLTPLAVDPSHPFPILNSGAIELAVSMTPPGRTDLVYAFVEVPEGLPRFIEAEDGAPGKTFVLLEELIMDNLDKLFTGCRIDEFFPFRITRDMDFTVEGEGVEDLLARIERNLLQRRQREPIRLELPEQVSGGLVEWLRGQLQLEEQFCYPGPGPLYLKQFFELVAKAAAPGLLEPVWMPIMPPEFERPGTIFEIIEANSPLLLAPPFHTFSPIVRLLEEAAEDPDVLAIKQTLYRVSGNSPVVRALQRAAENGKQVTVIVELKARFDEGNNIAWARKLEESGAHVVYGVSDLKIHCKALLVVRREEGYIRRYVHLATGNYNDKTAALYTDLGIMSCDPELCSDIANLFNVMTGYSAPPADWNRIAVAPFDLRKKLLDLIDRETRFAASGQPARIVAKMNSLSDPEVVSRLHAAAAAGVKLDLIVRGICSFKPGKKENVKVVSIVDRYLEHTRLFCFQNGGAPEYYLASADWMYRNLSRRIELMFPIESPKLRKICDRLLALQLADTEKGRRLLVNGRYTRNLAAKHTPERSQAATYRYFQTLAEAAKAAEASGVLKVYSNSGSDHAKTREASEK